MAGSHVSSVADSSRGKLVCSEIDLRDKLALAHKSVSDHSPVPSANHAKEVELLLTEHSQAVPVRATPSTHPQPLSSKGLLCQENPQSVVLAASEGIEQGSREYKTQPLHAVENLDGQSMNIIQLLSTLGQESVTTLRDGLQESLIRIEGAVASLEKQMRAMDLGMESLRSNIGIEQRHLSANLGIVLEQVGTFQSSIAGCYDDIKASKDDFELCRSEFKQCRDAIDALRGQDKRNAVAEMVAEMSNLQDEFADFQKHMIVMMNKFRSDFQLADELSKDGRERLDSLEILTRGLQGTLRENTNDVLRLKQRYLEKSTHSNYPVAAELDGGRFSCALGEQDVDSKLGINVLAGGGCSGTDSRSSAALRSSVHLASCMTYGEAPAWSSLGASAGVSSAEPCALSGGEPSVTVQGHLRPPQIQDRKQNVSPNRIPPLALVVQRGPSIVNGSCNASYSGDAAKDGSAMPSKFIFPTQPSKFVSSR